MNSKLKRPLLAAGIVVGVCALVWGGLTLLRNGSRRAGKGPLLAAAAAP